MAVEISFAAYIVSLRPLIGVFGYRSKENNKERRVLFFEVLSHLFQLWMS